MRTIKNSYILLFFIGILYSMEAQNIEFKNYSFSDKPIEIPEKFKNEDEIILEKNSKVEFIFDNNQGSEYYLFHEKKLLNSNNAIERNNKIYIPYKSKDNLVKNQLRVILPNGKKIELKESDIKKEVNEQNGVTYEYFAVNGLEKGAIIERFYIIKSPAEITGTTITIEGSYPIVNTSFELIYPNHLEFQTKSYNNLPEAEFTLDKYEGKNSTLIEAQNITALNKDEVQSNWLENAKSFRYKLKANHAKNLDNLYMHRDFVSGFTENYYVELNAKEKKEIQKFISKIDKSKDPLIYLRSIEALIKENIKYNRYYKSNNNITDIIKSKQGNLFDLLKIYLAVLAELDLEHELVFTTEKTNTIFDPEFESYENIKDVLLYFPSTDTFIEPAATNYRTPLFDFEYGNNFGLFIKQKIYQDVKIPVTSIRKIPFKDGLNISKMDILLDASQGIENAKFHSNLQLNGYTASYYQIVKDFVDESSFNEMKIDLAKNYAYETNDKPQIKTTNDGVNFLALKPYEIEIDGNAGDLIIKAGTNYLIKIGSVIGKQMELYSEKERQLPIAINFPHYYERSITLIIPEGYKIKNPEILNMTHHLTKDGKSVANFTSNYEMDANKIIINNREHYDFETLPVSDYSQYREIVNAAADFHKLNLILEKI